MPASTAAFRILDDGREVSIDALVRHGKVLVTHDALKRGLGWEVKPEGLCKGPLCVPVRDPDALVPNASGEIDLAVFAEALGRPYAVEAGARIAALGVGATERASRLATLEAPDFELPDLSGHRHRLSEHRGKKVLLIAYASW